MNLDTPRYVRIGACALLAAAFLPCWAHTEAPEYIEAFDTRLEMRPDGVLEISHEISFHPHGEEIRRGLFFELPDGVGPLSDFSARIDDRDVAPEIDDGALIVAAAEPLAIQQTHRMQVSYRAAYALRESTTGQPTLAWRPVVAQFELPWRHAGVALAWPDGPAPSQLPPGGERFDGEWRINFQGPLAAGSADVAADVAAGAGQRLAFQWQPGAFPDSVIRKTREHWARRAMIVLGILILWGLVHSFWRAVGRDPELGRVRPGATPPSDISPAAARFVKRMGFDAKTFVAALVSLRVKGRISLDPVKDKKKLRIVRLTSEPEGASPGERALEKVLFADSSRVELKPGSSIGQKASSALSKALGREHRGRHFRTNNRQRVGSLLLGVGLIVVSIGALVSEMSGVIERDPLVIALSALGMLVGVVVPLVYFELMKAPTRAGLGVRREVEALRLYMADSAPATSSADEFAALLPYAVALEVEAEWQARFGDRLDDSDGSRAAAVVDWYRKIQEDFDSTAAIVTIIAASAATTTATASAGGASAGGV